MHREILANTAEENIASYKQPLHRNLHTVLWVEPEVQDMNEPIVIKTQLQLKVMHNMHK